MDRLFLAAAFLMALAPAVARADLTIDASSVGSLVKEAATGFPSPAPPSMVAAGGQYSTGAAQNLGAVANNESRDYFVFNLSQLTGPITGITLQIAEPSGGYTSDGDINSVTFNLTDVSQDAASLPGNNVAYSSYSQGTTGYDRYLSEFNDIGSGTLLGSRSVSATDDGTTLSIDLNAAAIASVLANEGGLLAIGGSIEEAGRTGLERIFLGSNSSGVSLVVHTSPPAVPEPASLVMLGTGVVGLLGFLRRKKSAELA